MRFNYFEFRILANPLTLFPSGVNQPIIYLNYTYVYWLGPKIFWGPVYWQGWLGPKKRNINDPESGSSHVTYWGPVNCNPAVGAYPITEAFCSRDHGGHMWRSSLPACMKYEMIMHFQPGLRSRGLNDPQKLCARPYISVWSTYLR